MPNPDRTRGGAGDGGGCMHRCMYTVIGVVFLGIRGLAESADVSLTIT